MNVYLLYTGAALAVAHRVTLTRHSHSAHAYRVVDRPPSLVYSNLRQMTLFIQRFLRDAQNASRVLTSPGTTWYVQEDLHAKLGWTYLLATYGICPRATCSSGASQCSICKVLSMCMEGPTSFATLPHATSSNHPRSPANLCISLPPPPNPSYPPSSPARTPPPSAATTRGPTRIVTWPIIPTEAS